MKRCCGFSLIELMTVLSIIAIVSVMSLTGFRFFSQKTTTDISATRLIRAIQLARSEAISRQEKTILCGSLDQMTCANEWKKGYMVKTSDRVIYHFPSDDQNGKLYWRFFPVNKKQLEFLPTGLPNSQNGTFWFCTRDKSKPAWAIVMNQTGRVRTVYPNKDGDVCDDKGVQLQCGKLVKQQKNKNSGVDIPRSNTII